MIVTEYRRRNLEAIMQVSRGSTGFSEGTLRAVYFICRDMNEGVRAKPWCHRCTRDTARSKASPFMRLFRLRPIVCREPAAVGSMFAMPIQTVTGASEFRLNCGARTAAAATELLYDIPSGPKAGGGMRRREA